MKAVEIKKDIWWVGAVDWYSRDFHGYALSPEGTTYNAFLIKDEKVTLFDTVKKEHGGEYFCNIAQALGGNLEAVDYLVINHLEPDHAGVVLETIQKTKPEKIFISPMGLPALESIYHTKGMDLNLEVVKTGQEVSIGKRTLQFLETRMLHWPDNMMTYVPQDKVVFSSDGFGQNWATSARFADEVEKAKLAHLMREYYANIVLPFSPIVQKTFAEIQKLGLDIDMICPDHGLLFRGPDVAWALEQYTELALQRPAMRAVIILDSMWHSTETMARAIAGGLMDGGVEVQFMHVKANHHSRIMTEVSKAGAVLVGSPTHNNGILPFVAGFLQYMKGLKPQNKVGGTFGSFGWSGESVKILTEALTAMNIPVVEGSPRIKNRPTHADLAACADYGRKVAEALKAKVEAFGK